MYRTILLLFIICFFIPFPIVAQLPAGEVIEETTHLEIRNKKLTRTESVVLQINDRTEDRMGHIPIFYSKGDKVTILEARLEDMEGRTIRTLNKKEINDRSYISGFSLYQDDFVKSFELKHNQYPYRIVYSYQVTTPRFLIVEYLNYRSYPYPIRKKEVIVDTSPDQPILYKQKNIPEPQIEEWERGMRYTWSFRHLPSGKKEVLASPNLSDAPYLYIHTKEFDFGKKGSWESWESFARWIGELNKGRSQLTDAEKKNVDNLLKGIREPKEKAEVLYEYVWKNTRYINISIKLGGLQTYPASYVCENKYGDCKALSNYYHALLSYAGIPAYYTLVHLNDRVIDVDPEFPAQVFNHVIVALPLDDELVFIDCTSNGLPFGYIPSPLQGRYALLTGEGGRLVKIPSVVPEETETIRNILVKIHGNSHSLVEMNSRLRGTNFEEAHYMSTQVNKNLVTNYLKNNILTGSYTLDEYAFERRQPNVPEIELKASINYHSLWKQYGRSYLLEPFPFKLPSFESSTERTQAVQIDYPISQRDTVIYEFGETIRGKVPEPVKWDTRYGTYEITYLLKENTLEVCKSVHIPSARYEIEEYEAFYEFISKVKKQESKTVLIDL